MSNTMSENELSQFLLQRYCICDSTGKVNDQKMQRGMSALRDQIFDPNAEAKDLPSIQGIPARIAHLESTDQLQDMIRKYHPMVSKSAALNNLSFINPLQLATDVLGISVTEPMARFIRSSLRGAVSFREVELPFNGTISGIKNIRWNVK